MHLLKKERMRAFTALRRRSLHLDTKKRDITRHKLSKAYIDSSDEDDVSGDDQVGTVVQRSEQEADWTSRSTDGPEESYHQHTPMDDVGVEQVATKKPARQVSGGDDDDDPDRSDSDGGEPDGSDFE